MHKEKLTIIVTCYNKGNYVKETIFQIVSLKNQINFYDVHTILIDDASNDHTSKNIEEAISGRKSFQLIKNGTNLGVGGSIKQVLRLIESGKFIILSGDNDLTLDSLVSLCKKSESYKVTLGYFANSKVRGVYRKTLSTIYTYLLNKLMSSNLKYVNSPGIYDYTLIKKINFRSDKFASIFELNYLATKLEVNYIQIPINMNNPKEKESKSIRIATIIDTIKSVYYLRTTYSHLR
jgi:glycosyltransferase involved in cell wall biosynthesis